MRLEGVQSIPLTGWTRGVYVRQVTTVQNRQQFLYVEAKHYCDQELHPKEHQMQKRMNTINRNYC
jgi:hypothetical protein